ncbi:MAG TPA: hypothetical protein VH572_00065 [Gaiella sp.]|jgi:hypothetical protein
MTDDEEDVIIENQRFTVPLPPGFHPPFPPHGGAKFLFVRSDEESAPGKEHEDIMLRRVPRETAMRFRAAAGGRGLTHAQYLTALVALHARLRELADQGDDRLRTELDRLGLTTVQI